jgi:hypothetical protein
VAFSGSDATKAPEQNATPTAALSGWRLERLTHGGAYEVTTYSSQRWEYHNSAHHSANKPWACAEKAGAGMSDSPEIRLAGLAEFPLI